MSKIIIDGYNITGIQHKDVEAERARLIKSLAEYKKGKSHEITVVFDGWKNGGLNESHSVIGGIKVIYSRLAEKADSVIKRLISEGNQYIVITSDRDIQSYAWTNNSVPVDSEDFICILEGERLEEEQSPNKNSLSKKDKAKKRAIDKL